MTKKSWHSDGDSAPVREADGMVSADEDNTIDRSTEEPMENEMQHASEAVLDQIAARLVAAVEQLESALPRLNVAASEAVGPIVAMVEGSREAELAERLAEAEKTIAELRAASTHVHEGRKTLPVSLLAKQENGMTDSSALDAALGGLSLEQRIAVKSQLLRAGLV